MYSRDMGRFLRQISQIGNRVRVGSTHQRNSRDEAHSVVYELYSTEVLREHSGHGLVVASCMVAKTSGGGPACT